MSKVSEFVDGMVNKGITFEIRDNFVLMSPPSKLTASDLLTMSKIKNEKLIRELWRCLRFGFSLDCSRC